MKCRTKEKTPHQKVQVDVQKLTLGNVCNLEFCFPLCTAAVATLNPSSGALQLLQLHVAQSGISALHFLPLHQCWLS